MIDDAYLTARIDQLRARLRDLTTVARAHQFSGHCALPGDCPGDTAATALEQCTCTDIQGMLALALCDRTAAPLTRAELIDCVAGTLLACNADIITADDGSATFADEPKWRSNAVIVVKELMRIGALAAREDPPDIEAP